MNLNTNGGFYIKGVAYNMTKKMEVLQVFLQSTTDDDRSKGKIHLDQVAKTAGVSMGYAHKVITEYLSTGALEDPKWSTNQLSEVRRNYTKLGPEESIVLLALRAEDDQQFLVDYQEKLLKTTGVLVSTATIDRFFKHHFYEKPPSSLWTSGSPPTSGLTTTSWPPSQNCHNTTNITSSTRSML